MEQFSNLCIKHPSLFHLMFTSTTHTDPSFNIQDSDSCFCSSLYMLCICMSTSPYVQKPLVTTCCGFTITRLCCKCFVVTLSFHCHKPLWRQVVSPPFSGRKNESLERLSNFGQSHTAKNDQNECSHLLRLILKSMSFTITLY